MFKFVDSKVTNDFSRMMVFKNTEYVEGWKKGDR